MALARQVPTPINLPPNVFPATASAQHVSAHLTPSALLAAPATIWILHVRLVIAVFVQMVSYQLRQRRPAHPAQPIVQPAKQLLATA
jgi:hypothetical protein